MIVIPITLLAVAALEIAGLAIALRAAYRKGHREGAMERRATREPVVWPLRRRPF